MCNNICFVISITNEDHTIYLHSVIHDEICVTPFRFDGKIYPNKEEAQPDVDHARKLFCFFGKPCEINIEDRDSEH